MSSTADSTDDEPLPSPPSISFDPSLHTQRQSAVHDLLRRISSTPRFHGQLTRLLDVGCGEGQILQRLSPCDDSLPLQAMTGIDIDAAHAASHTWSTLGAAPSDDRWSPLNLTLLHGSFENMLPANVGYHDVIVSVEVIEHLDPVPHSCFAPVLLGKMNPKICIVSTPNRDFNALFDFLEDLDPDGEKQESFHRDGVPYRMRHHDHRFEASRSEFRKWALKAAADFGYDVEFTGVGGLGRGMTLEGDDGYVLENAVKACSEPEAVPSGASDWDQLKSIVCETDDNAEGLNAARRMFGDCSQMAVFVIKPELERRHTEPEAPTSIGGKGLRLVHNHKYSCVQDEQWPPDLKLMLGIMMANRMKHLCPELIVDEWKKPDDEFVMDVLHRKERSLGYYPKDNNWGQRSWKGISDEALKEREKLFAKLGGRTWEVNAVEVIVESNTIWEDTYALQRACHFRYDVFLDIFRQIQPIPGEDRRTIIRTNILDLDKCQISMEVDVSVDEGSTIITATFPPKPSLRASDLELTPPPSQRARSEAEQSEDNSEYDYDTDRTVYEDADDAPFTGEFETIIEWVANRKEGAPKMRLPESQEVDGTLYLNEDPNTEEMVFRVRFFGPSRGESISKAEAARRLAIEEEEYHSGSRVEAVGTWWQEVEETEEGF